MKPAAGRALPLAAALALAAGAVATGPVAALLVSPLAVALALLALRPAGSPLRAGRWLLGAGAATAGVGIALALAGPILWGGLAVALGLGCARLGVDRVLAADAPQPDAPRPERLPVAVDELALLGAGLVGRASSLSLEGLVEALREAAARQERAGWGRDPGAAHARPPGLEKPRLDSCAWPGGGRGEHLSAASEFEPFDPELRDAWLGRAANRITHAWLRRAGSAPRPTLVCVAPQRLGSLRVLARLFDAERLERLGLDVALVPLPLQGPRAERPFGAALYGAEPRLTNAGVAQAVWDLRRLLGWLRAEGAPAAGIAGVGAGASVAAILASIDPRLVAAVLAAPIVSPSGHLRRVWPEPQRLAAAEAGLDERLLDRVLAPSAPLRHAPHLPAAGRLLVAARADRWVPAAEVRALHAHWEGPPLHWVDGSHLWPRRGQAEARVLAHLRTSLLAAADSSSLPLTRFRRGDVP